MTPSPLAGQAKRLLPVVVAVVMGVLAVSLMRQYLAEQRRSLEAERKKLLANYPQPVDVIVAAKDLSEGTTIEASQLAVAQIPEKFVQPYGTRNPKELIGQVTAAPIAEGEQVLLNKLRKPDALPTGSGLSAVTPKGRRAVTIMVDAITGVGGFVRPGDEVDILWSLKLPPQPGQQEGQVITLTLFQDVPILAVGRDTLARPAGGGTRAEGRPAAGQQEGPPEYMVTLALPPQDTAFLLFAREQGRVQLSLRPKPENEPRIALTPANINTLMESVLGTPSPQQQAETATKAPRQVEVYKGLKKDVVLLSEEGGGS